MNNDINKQINSEKDDSQNVRRLYGGSVNIDYHYSSHSSHSLKTKYLTNEHFSDGTYRILTPNCKYILKEDIVFNPRSDYKDSPNEEYAYFPRSDQSFIYPGSDREPGAFRLGFFTALSIETSNIIIDLNGHEMKFDKEFHMQQRFGTIISIGQGPFINGQGPSKFGDDIDIVENIVIKNGNLGLTSHHGMFCICIICLGNCTCYSTCNTKVDFVLNVFAFFPTLTNKQSINNRGSLI